MGLQLTKPKEPKADANPAQSSFDNAKLYVWVKALESKVNNLLREVDILKNNFTKKSNELKSQVTSLSDDVLEIKQASEKRTQKIDLIVKELKKTAGMEEVETIKKYMEYWNPMNFVTQRDLERAIDAKLGERRKASEAAGETLAETTPEPPQPRNDEVPKEKETEEPKPGPKNLHPKHDKKHIG